MDTPWTPASAKHTCSLFCSSSLTWRAVAFIHWRRKRNIHTGGGLAGVGSGGCSPPSNNTSATRVPAQAICGRRRHAAGAASLQQEQFPQPFTLLRISSCSFFLSSSLGDRRSVGAPGGLLLLVRIRLFWVFHRSAYKLPGVLRRVLWSPRSATLP